MKPLTLQEVVVAMEGTIDRSVPLGSVARVVTDSRSVGVGDLFFALGGERFDGHDFVGEALAGRAMAAVVRNGFEFTAPVAGRARGARPVPDAVLIRVDDPEEALGRLSRYYRRRVLGGAVTVVAVTGSNGKTTTKTMIAHVLAGRWKGKASVKSYNNAIGVPLTLLSAEPSDAFVICEVGTNAPGEIAGLGKLIEPEVAVITGISEAHLEGLGSLEGVAAEKLSLLHHLRPDGCAVLSADHEFLRQPLERDRDLAKIKCVTFGRWPEADLRLTSMGAVSVPAAKGRERERGRGGEGERRGVRDDQRAEGHGPGKSAASLIAFTVNGRFDYRLSVPGRHNVFNALAAIGVARRFGMDHEEIADRLASFALPAMRLEYERVGDLTLINDAYNANPASLAAAVEVLVETPAPGRRVLIVGDMRELGSASQRLHRQAARAIAGSGIDMVIAVGSHARLMSETIRDASEGLVETHAYGSTNLAKRRFVSCLRGNDTILVKGSRALGLEELAKAMRDWAGSPPGGSSPPKRGSSRRGRVKV